MGEGSQKLQTSIYKAISHRVVVHGECIYIVITIVYLKLAKSIDLKSFLREFLFWSRGNESD